jgi:hypothetical protein
MTISTIALDLLECVLPLKWLTGKQRGVHLSKSKNTFRKAHGTPHAINWIAPNAIRASDRGQNHLHLKPLRVIRVVEQGQLHGNVGRMVISGRMADVCAELDRLAACEAV